MFICLYVGHYGVINSLTLTLISPIIGGSFFSKPGSPLIAFLSLKCEMIDDFICNKSIDDFICNNLGLDYIVFMTVWFDSLKLKRCCVRKVILLFNRRYLCSLRSLPWGQIHLCSLRSLLWGQIYWFHVRRDFSLQSRFGVARTVGLLGWFVEVMVEQ